MDFGAALSTLIKPEPSFPLTADSSTLLALANLVSSSQSGGGMEDAEWLQKYPLNYSLANFAAFVPPRPAGPPLDFASLIASVTGQPKEAEPATSAASTAASSPPPSLASLPLPIPAQPSSPTQSSVSASSLSSGSSLGQSTQNSPSSARASTPNFGGYKRKANGTPVRKPPAPIPEDKKDQAYYERRKKNNDAAKRSRDARRQKEEHTAARAEFLQQENLQLRAQIDMLKSELTRVQTQVLLLSSSVVKEEMPQKA